MSLKKPSELFDQKIKHSNADADVSRIQEELGKVDSLKDQLETVTTSLNGTLSQVLDKNLRSIDDYSGILEDFGQRIDNFQQEILYKVDEIEKSNQILEGKVTGALSDAKISNNLLKEKVNKQISDVKTDVTIFERHQSQIIDTIDAHTEELSEIKTNVETQTEEISTVKSDVDILPAAFVESQLSNIKEVKEQVLSEVNNILSGNVYDNLRKLEEKIEYVRDTYKTVDLSEGLLNIAPDEKNSDPLTPLDQTYVTTDQLQKHYRLFLNRVQQQLATLGGGGETRLQFLDDIVGIATNLSDANGKYLQVDTSNSAQPFKFSTVSGGGGSGITTNAVRDEIQGFYGYTTDFYTVGVANTTQEVGAGVTTLIMPQVASDGINQYLPTVMSDVHGGDPWIGSGAPIGTGQTQFSLAGITSGASCIVRTALQFDPDIDHTNLDVLLRFTTNTGSTFDIKKEQALIMNEGADQPYISETLFSFFVGTTLEGTTKDNAGSFNVQVIPSDDGVLEVLAVTVNVVA